MRHMGWDYQQLRRCPARLIREIVRQLNEAAERAEAEAGM